nr:DUF6508 domain-containing protein [Endozoicomonas sp. OPT23]
MDWSDWLQQQKHNLSELEGLTQWLPTATLDDCQAWLTALARSERFSDGSIAASINQKTLHTVLARIEELTRRALQENSSGELYRRETE